VGFYTILNQANEKSPAQAPAKQNTGPLYRSKLRDGGGLGPATGKANSNEHKSEKAYRGISFVNP
jgi:hypothetical protein